MREVKRLVTNEGKRCQTVGDEHDYERDNMEPYDREHDLLSLIKNNLISDIALALSTSTSGCLAKDAKGNNILHLAVRLDHPEVFEMIFAKASFKTCNLLLNAKNNSKRTPE